MAQRTVPPADLHEQRRAMSYEEFIAWSDEDTHAEWVHGEAIVFMPPALPHQELAGFLHTLLSLYARFFNLGIVLLAPFEMQLFPGRSSREPDLLFVAREHRERLTPARLDGPADLVIELISDSSAVRDREEKFQEYQAAGVREYWLFDPRPGREQADFYRLTARGLYEAVLPDAQGRYHAATLPGFWLRLDWLWQRPLPDALTLLAAIAPQALHTALRATETPGEA